MANPGELLTVYKLARLARRGAWTNDPNDPNDNNHWNALPLQAGEELEAVYPASAARGRLRRPVNVRVTRGQEGTTYYVDTVNQPPAIGPVASVAKLFDRTPVRQPQRLRGVDVEVDEASERNKVRIRTPEFEVDARKEGFIGRPNTLSPRDQLRLFRQFYGS